VVQGKQRSLPTGIRRIPSGSRRVTDRTEVTSKIRTQGILCYALFVTRKGLRHKIVKKKEESRRGQNKRGGEKGDRHRGCSGQDSLICSDVTICLYLCNLMLYNLQYLNL